MTRTEAIEKLYAAARPILTNDEILECMSQIEEPLINILIAFIPQLSQEKTPINVDRLACAHSITPQVADKIIVAFQEVYPHILKG